MYVAFWGNGVAYSKKGFPLSPSTQTCWHFWAFLRAGTQRRSYYWPMAISIKKTSIQRLHRATEGGGGGKGGEERERTLTFKNSCQGQTRGAG